jgi:hypothetical protein|tara:strand:- start:39 stop:485 length:447 start_codon:yes stop_codon:yes gene_type:complete
MAINWTAIAVTAVAAKAYGTLYQGYAMAAYYQGKADIALLQGRTKAVEAKENANIALRKMNETIASNIAKGAAGGVTPFDGSLSVLNTMSMRYGVTDFYQAKDTQEIVTAFSVAEAAMLNNAAKTTKKGAIITAVADAAMGSYNIFGT